MDREWHSTSNHLVDQDSRTFQTVCGASRMNPSSSLLSNTSTELELEKIGTSGIQLKPILVQWNRKAPNARW
eukprot:5159461-Amphidinium_carterae.1